MSRKEVDSRIPALIRNNLQEKKRSFFVIVGDHAKDAIVKLHYIMSQADLKQNKSVLWAYKKKLLGFSSHRAKREKKIKKEINRGAREANDADAFELFVTLNKINYVYYKESEKVLGQTFGMCVLQDFEGITPNLLAKTIETVEGGGLVILLLKGMNSLKQLYAMSMDIHSRYRTEAHQDVVPRFNERFILSLGSCESCLVIDDELNVLPISGAKSVKALPVNIEKPKTPAQLELETIKESHEQERPLGDLLKIARTVDQGKALLTFVEAISEKTLRNTVTLTAARGRGKSAAMGVAVAAAVAYGYSNIFITSPSPENLKTLFEFIFKGFDQLGYVDHADYSIIQSTNPDFNKAIVRVNIHRSHRQTIQYIRPQDAHVLGQAELVVIDEAAAIPLPLVKKLLGPYLVFMASTINGYEGTGRSLSLKLIKQLREESTGAVAANGTVVADRSTGKEAKNAETGLSVKRLREITLSEPIRYAQGDSVEKWLNNLLCLDATLPRSKTNAQGCPDPSQCELLKVNRDTLFSFHPVSEKFLQQLVALYVASHYKNSPDDLQLLSDAPAHELYVLTAPAAGSNRLPEPLCVIQVALEGKISRQSVLNSLDRGTRPAGDLIPWLVSQQFCDREFPSLSGARVVRIATNPDYAGMGYGSKALELLFDFYEGRFADLSEGDGPVEEETMVRVTDAELTGGKLSDEIKVRDIGAMPPLFSRLSQVRPAVLDYVGVSYGLTQPLHKFWKRVGMSPLYLRQTSNDITGEHTCVMLRALERTEDRSWLGSFTSDFNIRFLELLSYAFRDFNSILCLSIDGAAKSGAKLDESRAPASLTKAGLDSLLSPYDLKRLESYCNGVLDYHTVLDLVPRLANLYFTGKLKDNIRLSGVQQAILLALGLQRKDIDVISQELSLQSSQLLAMFIKITKKMMSHFNGLVSGAIEAEMPDASSIGVSVANASGVHDDEMIDTRFAPLETSLEDELEEGGDEAMKEIRQKQRELINSLPLDQYEIEGDAPGWEDAEKQIANAAKQGKSSAVVSIKSGKAKRKEGPSASEIYEEAFGDKKAKKVKKVKKSH
ncbi:GNAT acetyltransferase 2-domain-containing protein [Truncatella angustata]|uniref:RNA cytidine acetyltransferase n=1 Tax=Truncatella angustata TaxID=152316 RepID=A0A9P8RGK6_9PEZI|nr:GNAT acetyltransferase 2-domain-containing protein [Truncatella angustata]KAH6645419.1 GNAT acetyltransferase 2-domain-containing protein [Truncatella angustata]KAH8198195.1 hypothetical protein TruAng_007622 [Truncatella angustata]